MSLNKLATELDLLEKPIVAASEVVLRPAIVSDGVGLAELTVAVESADLEAMYTVNVIPVVDPRNLTAIVPVFAPEQSTVGMVSPEDKVEDAEARRVDAADRRDGEAAIEEKRKRVMRLSWTVNVIAWMLLGIGFMFMLLLVMIMLLAMGVHTRGPTEFTWVVGTLSVTTLVQESFQLLIVLLSFKIKSD